MRALKTPRGNSNYRGRQSIPQRHRAHPVSSCFDRSQNFAWRRRNAHNTSPNWRGPRRYGRCHQGIDGAHQEIQGRTGSANANRRGAQKDRERHKKLVRQTQRMDVPMCSSQIAASFEDMDQVIKGSTKGQQGNGPDDISLPNSCARRGNGGRHGIWLEVERATNN